MALQESDQEVVVVPFSRDQNQHLKSDFERLNRAWIEKLFKIESADLDQLQHPERIVDKGGYVVFALLNDIAVGTGALTVASREKGVLEVIKMCVDENCRGKGIGNQIMKHLIDYGQSKNYKRFFIETNSSLPAAISLYRKHGFVDDPEVKESPHGYERADVYLRLDINAPNTITTPDSMKVIISEPPLPAEFNKLDICLKICQVVAYWQTTSQAVSYIVRNEHRFDWQEICQFLKETESVELSPEVCKAFWQYIAYGRVSSDPQVAAKFADDDENHAYFHPLEAIRRFDGNTVIPPSVTNFNLTAAAAVSSAMGGGGGDEEEEEEASYFKSDSGGEEEEEEECVAAAAASSTAGPSYTCVLSDEIAPFWGFSAKTETRLTGQFNRTGGINHPLPIVYSSDAPHKSSIDLNIPLISLRSSAALQNPVYPRDRYVVEATRPAKPKFTRRRKKKQTVSSSPSNSSAAKKTEPSDGIVTISLIDGEETITPLGATNSKNDDDRSSERNGAANADTSVIKAGGGDTAQTSPPPPAARKKRAFYGRKKRSEKAVDKREAEPSPAPTVAAAADGGDDDDDIESVEIVSCLSKGNIVAVKLSDEGEITACAGAGPATIAGTTGPSAGADGAEDATAPTEPGEASGPTADNDAAVVASLSVNSATGASSSSSTTTTPKTESKKRKSGSCVAGSTGESATKQKRKQSSPRVKVVKAAAAAAAAATAAETGMEAGEPSIESRATEIVREAQAAGVDIHSPAFKRAFAKVVTARPTSTGKYEKELKSSQ